MEMYRKVEQFVHQLFAKGEKKTKIKHLERTVYWVLQLKPDADEALQIAALTHDIERASRDPNVEQMIHKSPNGYVDEAYLKRHSERGAGIIAEFLMLQGADPVMVENVRMLVAGHEFSGTDDQNILKDADSISYFENAFDEFVALRAADLGIDKVKAKVNFMFNRITSEEARRIVAPLYHKALNRLENK